MFRDNLLVLVLAAAGGKKSEPLVCSLSVIVPTLYGGHILEGFDGSATSLKALSCKKFLALVNKSVRYIVKAYVQWIG